MEGVKDRFVSVFSFDGKLDDLTNDSELIYHGPSYRTILSTNIKYDQKMKFEKIQSIIRDNWELGRSTLERGYLITQDFEGEMWITDQQLVYGMNYLEKTCIDNFLKEIDGLSSKEILGYIDEILDNIKISNYNHFQLQALKANELSILGKFEKSNRLVEELLESYDQMEHEEIRRKITTSRDETSSHYNPYFNFDKGALLLLFGVNHRFLKEMDKAKASLIKAVDEWKEIGLAREEDLMNAYNNLGAVEVQNNNLEIAYNHYENALKLSRQLKKNDQMLILLNIANLHRRLEQFDFALDVVLEAETLPEISDIDLIKIYEMKASILIHNSLEKAKNYYKKALDLAVEYDQHYSQITFNLYQLILIAVITEDFPSANSYYQKLIEIKVTKEDSQLEERILFLKIILAIYGKLKLENALDKLLDLLRDKQASAEIRVQSAIFYLKFLFSPGFNLPDNLSRGEIMEEIELIGSEFQLQVLMDAVSQYKDRGDVDIDRIERLINNQLYILKIKT